MRLIDADALLYNLEGTMAVSPTGYIHGDTIVDMIGDAPTIEPELHWIPCSERLPKKNGFYLCTTKDCITILEFIEGNPHYHEEPSFVSDVLGKCNSYVVAWMPLPECYREGES